MITGLDSYMIIFIDVDFSLLFVLSTVSLLTSLLSTLFNPTSHQLV
jgi:hypothetical protein